MAETHDFNFNDEVQFELDGATLTGLARLLGDPTALGVQVGMQWYWFGTSPLSEGPLSLVHRLADPFAGTDDTGYEGTLPAVGRD